MNGAPVWLVGPAAEALAPRLELSGYQPHPAGVDPTRMECGPSGEPTGEPTPTPAAVILSPRWERWIPALRQRWGAVPLLLGIETDSVEGRSHCLASGADDFWLTTLGPSDLLTRLRLHLALGRSAGAPIPLLQLADLQVQPEARRVQRGQRELTLTAREYQLLLLLLRHRDAVVSRERILREIWDDQQTAASNVIEVYVRYLRQKLEEGGERRLIHTVRGVGYSLSERPPQQEGER